jgi:hypothetical protein
MPFSSIARVVSAGLCRTSLGTKWAGAILAGSLLAGSIPARADEPSSPPGQTVRPGLRFTHETARQPRPLEIHVLAVDLDTDGISIEALVPPDPDADGPAESSLVKPEQLAAQADIVAAVNANAFGALPDASGKTPESWRIDMPVTICGWARSGGVDKSPAENSYAMFWIDAAGRAHTGTAPGPDLHDARVAVAGFGLLLSEGKVVTPADTALHPRTAVGTDGSGRHVWLVVVDGRQPGVSEGVSCHELAGIMQRLGCSDAVNLDGGGSTVVLKAAPSGNLEIANRPSGKSTRPVPVMLAVRHRPAAADDASPNPAGGPRERLPK